MPPKLTQSSVQIISSNLFSPFRQVEGRDNARIESDGFILIQPNENTKVSGSTGVANPVRMAVCEKLMLGKIVIRNAYFLVFNDAALNLRRWCLQDKRYPRLLSNMELGTIKTSPRKLDISKGLELPARAETNPLNDLVHPVIAFGYKVKLCHSI